MPIHGKDPWKLKFKMSVTKELGLLRDDRLQLLSVIDIAEFPIVLYGAGSGFHSFSAFVLSKFDLKVSKVVDRKFEVSQVFCGHEATSPAQYFNNTRLSVPTVVIVTIGKPEEYQAICIQLANYECLRVYWAYDFFEYFSITPQ